MKRKKAFGGKRAPLFKKGRPKRKNKNKTRAKSTKRRTLGY